ncbi:hypothetical protein [Stenotrophomonas sp. SY1]|uniref:hypothetical protein n=1 Tax=Stenotrophomonas sp. SY1 TaxID=477235 RepID=UPI001E58FFCB|nr:hypothetical protein [Stenotrophomonas sp. SY1]MCD9085328.1 hypothetical protein [Stenotrophomonas sp. SY1]
MTFRFFLQPTMALITALIDGIKDAKAGKSPYAWLLSHGSLDERKVVWREGVTATTRILLLGVGMDVIYQFRVFGGFEYPLETLVIAIVLGFVPYLLLRGPINRIASHWLRRDADSSNPKNPKP